MNGRPHGARGRYLWSLLASALLNLFLWVTMPAYLSAVRSVPAGEPREQVAFSPVRIEHRGAQRRKPRRTAPAPVDTTLMAPPQPATLALPDGWSRQDFGYLETTDAAEWLNWKKQSAKWVPRVFLWRYKAEEGYMSRPSLHNTIQEILSSLHDEHAKVYVSRAQAVCDGQRSGWFLSYVKSSDDPPLQFDETLFVADGMIYRATYIRAEGQDEDANTRAALNTLCV